MNHNEREELKTEKAGLVNALQGMIGYLNMANDSFHFRTNLVLTNDLKDFDWKLFENMTKEARDIQIEANQTIARIWQIEHTLMNNPNFKEIRKGGGLLGAKLRANQIQKASQAELTRDQVALREWEQRVQKVEELRGIWEEK